MANPMFDKIIAKKKAEGKSMSPVHKEAKGSVLKDLMEHLGGMGMDKINGMKKISVASDSKKGLSKGLETAAKMISKDPLEAMTEDPEMSSHGSNDPQSEGSEMDESMEHEESEESDDDLRAKIAELEAKIAAMKG